MSELYDDEDDDYDDDHYNYDYSDKYDQYKFYFKFDIDSTSSLSDWLINLYKDININIVPGFPFVSFPVNDLIPNTASGGNSLLYVGNNQYGETIYKNKHFIEDKMKQKYILHLQSHAGYFVSQPSYYKGLFEILN